MKKEHGWVKLHADSSAAPVFAFPLAWPTALGTHDGIASVDTANEQWSNWRGYADLAHGAQNYIHSINDRRLVAELQ